MSGPGGGTRPFPAWKVILATIRFRPRLWLLNTLALFFLMFFFMLPGVLVREFFNLVSGTARTGLNLGSSWPCSS